MESLAFGLQRSESKSLNLDIARLKNSLRWARYMAIRAADLDVILGEEAKRFREFARWLKYGQSGYLRAENISLIHRHGRRDCSSCC